MLTNTQVEKAQKQLEEILSDPEMKKELYLRERARIDNKFDIDYARREGRELGEKYGLKRGRRLGEKQGLIRGKLQIAQKLLKQGMSIEQIAEITDLSKEEISKIKQKESKER